MPSRWRATSSRIEKARPSDCTPPRARSSASSSMLGSLDGTSRAIETLPFETLLDVACLSLVFGLGRGFTGIRSPEWARRTLSGRPRPLTAPGAFPHHTTIAIDVQYYEK